MNQLLSIVKSLGTARVVLVGDFMLDEYIYGDVAHISPEAPVPIVRVVRREFRGGGASNVGVALAALQAQVGCIGVMGDDVPASQLQSLLEAVGVETSGLLRRDDRPTTVKKRIVGLAQHRHSQQIMRVDEESTDPVDSDVTEKILDAVQTRLAEADVLALEDYDKGVLCDNTTPRLIEVARGMNKTVIVDPARIRDYRRYYGATLLTPNRYEAELASGVTIACDKALEEAADRILKIADAEAVVITLDREGAYLKIAGAPGQRIPTEPREVYDVTGAGDVVMAVLCVAVAEGMALAQAVAMANVAGGLEVQKFGVVPITRDDIELELQRTLVRHEPKHQDSDCLQRQLNQLRRTGKIIVFTNGCFDLLHMGHVRFLQQARGLGSCLVVAVNSDDSVRRLKGPGRPIIPQDERIQMLASLECVDFVTFFEEDTPCPLLERLRPGILVKGGSTTEVVGADIVKSYGGTVQRLDLVEGMSTTTIIDRIMATS